MHDMQQSITAQHLMYIYICRYKIYIICFPQAGMASGVDETALTPLIQKVVEAVSNYKVAAGSVKNLMPKAKAKAKAKSSAAP